MYCVTETNKKRYNKCHCIHHPQWINVNIKNNNNKTKNKKSKLHTLIHTHE